MTAITAATFNEVVKCNVYRRDASMTALPVNRKLIFGVDQSFHAFDVLIGSLPTPTDEATGNFYPIVTAISRAAMKNYATLRQAFDDDSYDLLAWSCRNLLELDIFMKYVLMSKANADEFATHRLIDGLEIAEHLQEFDLHANPSPINDLDFTIGELKQKMAAEGMLLSRRLSTRQWAKIVHMGEDYDAVNKVCSKLIHPTAWAILTEGVGSDLFPEAREIFYGSGARYFMDIFVSIKEHIRQYGVNHKRWTRTASSKP